MHGKSHTCEGMVAQESGTGGGIVVEAEGGLIDAVGRGAAAESRREQSGTGGGSEKLRADDAKGALSAFVVLLFLQQWAEKQ